MHSRSDPFDWSVDRRQLADGYPACAPTDGPRAIFAAVRTGRARAAALAAERSTRDAAHALHVQADAVGDLQQDAKIFRIAGALIEHRLLVVLRRYFRLDALRYKRHEIILRCEAHAEFAARGVRERLRLRRGADQTRCLLGVFD